jgi:hypothetical protein
MGLDGSLFFYQWTSRLSFEVAMQVVGSPEVPEWSTVVRLGRCTDEDLAADFWLDLGFPTPASRVWEKASSSRAGTSPSLSCRNLEGPLASVDELGFQPSTGARREVAPSTRGLRMQQRARAGTVSSSSGLTPGHSWAVLDGCGGCREAGEFQRSDSFRKR